MALPFTVEQFYGVFRDYNTAVWPAQWILVALALVAVGAVLRPQPWSGVAVPAILGVLWAWIALSYHLASFVRISPAAYGFAAISAVGAVVFTWQGVVRRSALGIRNAFLNQPVEVAALRPRFAAALGLSGQRPDLMVRFGRGPAMPRSLRRPVEAALV